MAKPDPRQGGGGTGYFPAVYNSALAQTAEDYDSIMGQYKGLKDSTLAGGGQQERLNFTPINPTSAEYQPGSDYSYLKNFVNTGGYSDADVGNLRERAVSPIRSIYSTASKNIDRQKRLQGGYSPNAGALQAKLARESGYAIGDASTNANAAIAEMVQRGKLAGATALAPLEARETENRNAFNLTNANTANDFLKFNAQMPLEYGKFNAAQDNNDFEKILSTIQGQQGLYSASPGLMGTLGNQTISAANTANNFPPVPRAPAYKNPLGSGGVGINSWNMGRNFG